MDSVLSYSEQMKRGVYEQAGRIGKPPATFGQMKSSCFERHPLAGRNNTIRSDCSSMVYNPRNGILMRHGFENLEMYKDIRLCSRHHPYVGMVADPDGSADFFNQRWLDYTGLSAEQALGSGWQVAIHPDELPRILETFLEALNSVSRTRWRAASAAFDGEFRWFLFRGSPLRDRSGKVAKWYGTKYRSWERKRAEDALRKSEETVEIRL